jgi:hypothetical protein
MINDLDEALMKGKPWPPVSEVERITRCVQNEQLFMGEHQKVYLTLLHLFSDHTAEYNKIISIFNFHKRLSTLWADFLFGETPKASASEQPEAPEQQYLNSFINRNQYWLLQHARQIDVSRFGQGVIEAYYDGERCNLQLVHPTKYFQIGGPDGVTAHVVAWLDPPKEGISKLNVRVHRPGEVETRQYEVSSAGKIVSDALSTNIVSTGVNRPLISVIGNTFTSSIECSDDYRDIDPIIKRIEARLTRVGRILDVHAEPFLVLPEFSGAFHRDEHTGKVVYDSKLKVFELPKEGMQPQYITWDGQLAAAFNEIDALMRQLYIVSETCEACFEPAKLGAQVSGTALRLMLFVPLKKVERLKLAADPVIKSELQLFADFERAKGVDGAVPIGDVSIQWQDGLPNDFRETVQNVTLLKTQGLIWDEMALKLLFGLEGQALQEALDKLHGTAPQAARQGAATAETAGPIVALPGPEEGAVDGR